MILPEFSVRGRFKTLDKFGLAAIYVPGYLNLEHKPHTVDAVLLSYVIRGKGRHVVDGEEFEEEGPSLSVIHYGCSHCIVTSPEGMDVVNIMLELKKHALPELPEPLASVLPDLTPLDPRFQNRLTRLRRLKLDRPKAMTELVLRLEREFAERRPGYETAALDCFRLFLIECCRQMLETGLAPEEHGDMPSLHRLEKVRRIIDTQFRSPLTLKQLADDCGLTRNYLCRAFKEYSGKTVFAYLIERRIQAAVVQLLSSRKKIIEIAFDCGFNDLSHFNRKFNEIIGSSPTAFRQKQPQTRLI